MTTKFFGVHVRYAILKDKRSIIDEMEAARQRVAQALACIVFQDICGARCPHGFFRGWEYVPKHTPKDPI